MQPNCIKVPKEVCVEAKVNPRKVRRTLVGERRTHHLKTKQAPELEDALGDGDKGDTGDTALTDLTGPTALRLRLTAKSLKGFLKGLKMKLLLSWSLSAGRAGWTDRAD